MKIELTCPGCGRLLRVGDQYRGKRTKCPLCGTVSQVPSDGPDPLAETFAVQRVLPAVSPTSPASSPAPDARSYAPRETGPVCPHCRKNLPPGAVLCVDCGYDLRTGEQLETARQPFVRSWEVGMPLALRLAVFLCLECLFLFTAALLDNLVSALLLIFSSTVILALTLGMSTQLEVTRTARGKVLLTRTWSLFFIPALRRQVNLRRYHAIVIGDGTNLVGCLSWILLLGLALFLMPWLLIPRLFWSGPSHPTNYFVSLKEDYRQEVVPLYWTWSDSQLRDIVDTLQELADLRIDRT